MRAEASMTKVGEHMPVNQFGSANANSTGSTPNALQVHTGSTTSGAQSKNVRRVCHSRSGLVKDVIGGEQAVQPVAATQREPTMDRSKGVISNGGKPGQLVYKPMC